MQRSLASPCSATIYGAPFAARLNQQPVLVRYVWRVPCRRPSRLRIALTRDGIEAEGTGTGGVVGAGLLGALALGGLYALASAPKRPRH